MTALTDERVVDLWSWAYAWRSQDSEGSTDLSKLREDQRAEITSWLARHDDLIRADEAELAAIYADQWGDQNEEGGYARSAHSIAHAIRSGALDDPAFRARAAEYRKVASQ
jgi:hypothetical protein